MHSYPTGNTGSTRLAIAWAGLACGVLDLGAAIGSTVLHGGTAVGLLQSVASVLMGRAAFSGGWTTVALGTTMHFCVAFTVAGIFVVAAHRIRWLLGHPAIAGIVYGAGVYVVMYRGVVPLGAVVRGLYLPDVVVRFPALTIEGLLIHLTCVGLPIALIAWFVIGRSRPA